MSPIDRLLAIVRGLKPSGGTTEQVAKSGVWLMSENVIGRLLQLAMLAVLARLVGPAELGLVGIALLTLSATKKFTNIGLNAALVQKVEENVDTHLNTTWVLEIGRGLLITAVLFVLAPIVANLVFSEPRATDLIRVVGLSPLILGVRNPAIVYFQKNLDFHKQFVYRVAGDAAQLVVGVGYALVEPTAWAFVFGFIAADVVRVSISYLILGYRPWPSFDLEIAKELIDYGKWLTGSSILYFMYGEGDDAFVGWFLTPTALAFYQYSYRFSNAPATELSQVVNRVMFPAFSKLQTDEERLRRAFLKTLRMTSLLSFPSAIGIAVVAPSFVLTFLGEQWMPAVPAMQVLAFYGLMRAIGRTFSPIWKTIGRPDYITKLSALRVLLMAILIYPMTDAFGIVGTALTVTVIFVFPMLPLDMYITSRAIDVPMRSMGYELVFPLVASVPMGLITWYLRTLLSFAPAVNFVILVLVGVVVFVPTVFALETLFKWNVSENFQRIYRNLAL